MKLTKYRLQKIINSNNKQTRKKFKKTIKVLKHTNTVNNRNHSNLHNNTLKQII